jgi:RNA ligase
MFDIFPESLLAQMVAEKMVAIKQHDTEPLRLLSYTDRAAYERVWNDCTRGCRGLIVDADNNVVARPFSKFFGIGEPEAPQFAAHTLVYVSDKRDGSLGIVYPIGEGWAVATRGSFHSPQAEHATQKFRDGLLSGELSPPESGVTDCYEIIFPENRIVIDYGGLDALIYIGSVDVMTGKIIEHPGDAFVEPYGDSLARPQRSNAEGFVITSVETGEMLKLKFSEYVVLHRFISHTTKRTVWEFAAVEILTDEGMDPSQIAKAMLVSTERVLEIQAAGDWEKWIEDSNLPQFFKSWVERKIAEIVKDYAVVMEEIRDEYALAIEEVGLDAPRGVFATVAKGKKHRAALFSMLDAKSIRPYALRSVYPEAEKATAIE